MQAEIGSENYYREGNFEEVDRPKQCEGSTCVHPPEKKFGSKWYCLYHYKKLDGNYSISDVYS